MPRQPAAEAPRGPGRMQGLFLRATGLRSMMRRHLPEPAARVMQPRAAAPDDTNIEIPTFLRRQSN
jgi:hypothetical protein